MKKLSIIRFKPKPECFDEFLADMQEFSRDRGTSSPPSQYLMVKDGETLPSSSGMGPLWRKARSPASAGSIPSATCYRNTTKSTAIPCRPPVIWSNTDGRARFRGLLPCGFRRAFFGACRHILQSQSGRKTGGL